MISMRVFHRSLLCLVALGLSCLVTAHASVTMLGSRIIYNAKSSSVDVQLKNNDTYPYVVQTWFDEGSVDANPQNSHAVPFLSTPPVFRIQAKAGQIVRIVYSGAIPLPKDRESVFWFNFLQVPPTNVAGDQKQNKMLIMLRTRVKLFYRPEGLTAPGDITKSLQVSAVRDGRKGLGIQVKNTSAWFASLSNMTVETGGSKIPMNVDMVAPFSSETFWLNGKSAPQQGRGKVTLTAINDQGARISEHYDVTYP